MAFLLGVFKSFLFFVKLLIVAEDTRLQREKQQLKTPQERGG